MALITGISGSGGSYLAEYIHENHKGVAIHGISRWHSTTGVQNLKSIDNHVHVHECDLLDFSSILNVLDVIAIVNMVLGSSDPDLSTADLNGDGEVTILDIIQLLNLISINFAGEASLYGNSSIAYNYDLDTFYNYLGYDFKNLGLHELNLRTSPNELINFRAEFEWGKDLSYNESIPEPGNLFSTSFSLRFQLSNNLSMTPSYRSSKLKKSSNENYFNGSISRLRLNYQFNNFLNIRLIAENNTFNEYRVILLNWINRYKNICILYFIDYHFSTISNLNSNLNINIGDNFNVKNSNISLRYKL